MTARRSESRERVLYYFEAWKEGRLLELPARLEQSTPEKKSPKR